MKYSLAMLAAFVVLVLATTLAFGEEISGTLSSWDTSPTGIYHDSRILCGSPFPMSADPALVNGSERDILPAEELPSSMASNLSSWDTAPTAVYFGHRNSLGSPFPMSADPALVTGGDQSDRKLSDVDFEFHGEGYTRNPSDSASPFPLEADPNAGNR
jgi:hypothetical protein